jgi:hypothetical protein
LQGYAPETAMVKVIGHTDPTPVLPYISAAGANQPMIFDVIANAIAALSSTDRATTRLRGIVAIPAGTYLAVPTPVA